MKRNEWVFKYTANALMKAAEEKRKHHQDRMKFWQDAKAKVMAEVKESGIEVSESEAASISNYTQNKIGPQVMVRNDLQRRLTECHQKIIEHDGKVREYQGWVEVFYANQQENLPLNSDDWLYFFGK